MNCKLYKVQSESIPLWSIVSRRIRFLYAVTMIANVTTVATLYSQEFEGIVKQFPFGLYTGETRSITDRAQLPNEIPQLFLSNNSKIELSPSVREWNLSSDETYVGQNATIRINWPAQEQAASGASGSSGGNCQTGGSGGPGQLGVEGQDGPYINLDLGVVRAWGSLTIDVSGQNGQAGGNGGQGGNGGRADVGDLCRGGNGGQGGAGGNGGSGGDGGTVIITWHPPDTLTPDEVTALERNIKNNLIVISNSGSGGSPGLGGSAGTGGASKCSDWGLFKICRGAGQPGSKGVNGTSGTAGNDGTLTITMENRP